MSKKVSKNIIPLPKMQYVDKTTGKLTEKKGKNTRPATAKDKKKQQ